MLSKEGVIISCVTVINQISSPTQVRNLNHVYLRELKKASSWSYILGQDALPTLPPLPRSESAEWALLLRRPGVEIPVKIPPSRNKTRRKKDSYHHGYYIIL